MPGSRNAPTFFDGNITTRILTTLGIHKEPTMDESRQQVIAYLSKTADLTPGLIDVLLKDPSPINSAPLQYFDYSQVPSPKTAVDGLVLVHATNYFPENGFVFTPYDTHKDFKDDPNSKLNKYRLTTHASVSSLVAGHSGGDWSDSKYVVLWPFKSIANKVTSFEPEDTFAVGPLAVDKNSRIVTLGDNNSQSMKDTRRTLIQNGVIDVNTMQQLIYSARGNSNSIINDIVAPSDWTVNLKLLISRLPDQDPTKDLLATIPTLKVARTLGSPAHFIVAQEIVKMGYLPMFYEISGDPESVFARLAGKQRSEHQWASSGLSRSLRKFYNNTTESRRQLHTHTPWSDMERLLKICADRDVFPGIASSEFTKQLIGIKDINERIEATIRSIDSGGPLRSRLMASIHSSNSRQYVNQALEQIKTDLEGLRTK